MLKVQRIFVSIAAAAVALFFFVCTYVVWEGRTVLLHADGAVMRSEAVLSKINASAVNLDAATKAWADSAKQQAGAVTDLAANAQGSLSAVDLTLASLRSNSDALSLEMGSLRKTTDAATTLTAALAIDAGTANETIAAGKPLLEAYTRDGNDLDALLKDHELTDTLSNIQATTQNIGGITADFERVTHKVADDYLKPVPWYERPVKYFGDFWDISAAIARHTP